jgi:voltage-gated potassium channel
MTDTLRTRTPEDERRLASFERHMALPIFVSAVVPIVLSLAGTESVLANVVLVVTWFVFVADFAVHVRLIPGYLRSKQGLFDLCVVGLTAPWFLIPGLGEARFLALARLARLARIVKAGGGAFTRLAAQLGQVGLVTALLVITCAYVANGAEHAVNSEFANYGDSLWWAVVTITTVGYGDITPVTTTGRVTAAVLMFSGLAVLGVLAGSLASFFGFGDERAEALDESAAAAEPAGPADRTSRHALTSDATELRIRLAELDRAVSAVRELLP